MCILIMRSPTGAPRIVPATMPNVAAAGIGAVSLGAENLPQPVNAATNDVQARSSQDDLKTAQENAKTAEAAKRASCFDRGGS